MLENDGLYGRRFQETSIHQTASSLSETSVTVSSRPQYKINKQYWRIVENGFTTPNHFRHGLPQRPCKQAGTFRTMDVQNPVRSDL